MSPIDDELRSALSSRTDSVGVSADLFAGVERRASRMRRQRAAATVAGAAMAVTALGVGGPMLADSLTSTADGPLDQAETSSADYALDPANPWPYRGDSVVRAPVEEAAAGAWAEEHGLARDDVRLSLLYGTRSEGAASVAMGVYVASAPGGPTSWGLVRTDTSGVVIRSDAALDPARAPLPVALLEVLEEDGGQTLLVVAAPQTQVQYCPVVGGPCTDAGEEGIGVVPLTGDTSRHGYRVLAPDGRVVDQGPAPYIVDESEPPAPGDEVPAPANALDWPAYGGSVSSEVVEGALTRFALEDGSTREQVGSRLLYGYEPPGSGQGYLLLQVWSDGDARLLGASYERRTGTVTSTTLSGPIVPGLIGLGPPALAVLLPGGVSGAQQLLVVPRPTAGQVLYSPDGRSEPRPVASQGTGAAVLIERAAGVSGDQLLVLDGDGDVDRPLYQGTVEELLATLR